MIKKVRDWLVANRVLLLSTGLGIGAILTIYLYRLGSFVRDDSIYESSSYLGIDSLQSIIDSISLAPVKILQYIAMEIDDTNQTLLRIVSLLFVLVSFVAFYLLILRWHTYRIAILATLLFVTASYSLHLGRFANQDAIYYFIIPILLLFGTWLQSKRSVHRLAYVIPILAILLYIPGFLYLVLLLPIIFKKRLLLAWQHVDIRKNIVALGASVLILVPLIYSVILKPSQIIELLALDRLLADNGLMNFLRELANIASSIFYIGPDQPYRWLTGTPILDIASIALLILGIYAYIKGPHTLRARLLALLLFVSIFIIGSSTLVTISVLIPLIYIIIANGIVFLLQSWLTVFPRNPAARNTAIVILTVFIALICSYQLQRYYIAWPNSPETKAALSIKAQ